MYLLIINYNIKASLIYFVLFWNWTQLSCSSHRHAEGQRHVFLAMWQARGQQKSQYTKFSKLNLNKQENINI